MDGRRKRDVRVSNFALDFDSRSMNMEGIDSNMVLEVPDTPDRLSMRRQVDGSSRPSWERSSFRRDVDPNCDPVRRMRAPCGRQPGHHNATNDTEYFFREASLARELCGDTETRPSSIRSITSRETNGGKCPVTVSEHEKAEKHVGDSTGAKPGDKGKGIDLCNNSKKKNVSNSVNGEVSSACNGIGDQYNAKGKGPCGDPAPALVTGQACRPRVTQRRLVRNGCISPLNIERSMKQKGAGTRNNGSLSNPVDIASPDSQDKNCGKLKGVVTVEDIVAADDGSSHSNSGHMLPRGEATTVSGVAFSGRRFEDRGWRTTRNRTGKSSSVSALGNDSVFQSENPSSSLFNGTHEVEMENGSSTNTLLVDCGETALWCGASTIGLPEAQESQRDNSGRISRKRRVGSSNSLVNECSSSISNDPGSFTIGSSSQPSITRSTRARRSEHNGLMSGAVIEVDELQSPEAVSYSLDRHRQVESDEMLARQLQEELYNETQGIGNTDEIDARVAMLLQENDGSDDVIARHPRSRRRDVSNLLTRTRSRRAAVGEINRARAPTPSNVAEMRRRLHSAVMARFGFMGSVGGFMGSVGLGGGDDARMFDILHTQRDFTEDDYETLLQLDENNHHGGASENQINSLPESIIQNADTQEACAVCLEPPSAGDTVRHLPCLHKFHKDCIDAWLRRKRTCPICKCDIR